ncbi:uncharacterized protein [Littorina saxatilis]
MIISQVPELSRFKGLLLQQNLRNPFSQSTLFRQPDNTEQNRRSKTETGVNIQNARETVKKFHPQSSRTNATKTLNPDATHGNKTLPSSSHDVNARSDDAGPLEAVISHISQQVTQMSASIQTLKNGNDQQNLVLDDARTSVFVQWGSSACSPSSELVYSGIVGGSFYTNTGAATNFLCLTLSPIFSDQPVPPIAAYLYGGEYETYGPHHEKDPLCAVCRSQFSTTVMIPGTNVCTSGWHLQYSGFLMAGAFHHTAGTEYICVDSRFEYRIGSDKDENGKLLYYTVTQCGTLPCSPYVNHKIVTCAVCSK